jgi:hypothetical protein
MSPSNLVYELHRDGYIHNWLLAGPQTIPVQDFPGIPNAMSQIIARHYCEHSQVGQHIQEWDPPFTVDGEELHWMYTRCLDDHLIDLSCYHPSWQYLRAWAYTEVDCAQDNRVMLALTACGPADLWIDDQHLHRRDSFHPDGPHTTHVEAMLHQGRNRILVRAEQVANGHTPYVVGLQLQGLAADQATVLLPTIIDNPERRRHLEYIIDEAYLDRDLYRGDDEVVVHWPADLTQMAEILLRFQDCDGKVSVEGQAVGKAGNAFGLVHGVEMPDAAYRVVVMPRTREYYEFNQRVKKSINLYISHSGHSAKVYGSQEERRLEALDYAARSTGGSAFTELAKMELGWWSHVKQDVLLSAIERARLGYCDSVPDLMAVFKIACTHAENPAFPAAIREALATSVCGARCWLDSLHASLPGYATESRYILLCAAEILAGQLYPDAIFAATGQTGHWHRETGEKKALAWLHARGTGGFADWDSGPAFGEELVALVNLAELAQNPVVRRLAGMVANKILFSIALNSYLGTWGTTQGRSTAAIVKNPQLSPTSGIMRILWGMGAYNESLPEIVTLATAQTYSPPEVISRIGRHVPRSLWSRERHASLPGREHLVEGEPWEVNKVTFKTPDYMLCSAQDWHKGQQGKHEHIWQATLGPDAVVFVTHPANASQNDALCPNYWCGNAALPRVAQWKNTLIALYNLPENDWMGMTHAYFPLFAFDEHVIRERWAFARRGEGYVALYASQGFHLVTRGENAYRELASYGQQNVWLCHMGRAARDGSFGEFQQAVLALDVASEGLAVRCVTLDGDSLAFGWEGPLLVNGVEEPITGFKHYDSRHCSADWPASAMELHLDARTRIPLEGESARLEFQVNEPEKTAD